MFAVPDTSSSSLAPAIIAGIASGIVAVIAGGIALRSNSKSNQNASDIEDYKSETNRDLERLKAKLAHGQTISETQWNAEFTAYQAIWKSMVSARNMSHKLLMREAELKELGLPDSYLDSPASRETRIGHKKALLENARAAMQELLLSVHDNAPFYPTPIRTAANETHRACKDLFDKHLGAFPSLEKGVNYTTAPEFIQASEAIWTRVAQGVELTEALIRQRLADVQVVYGSIA